MNKNTAPGWAYGFLNPNKYTSHRNAEGHILTTVHADTTGGGYITLSDLRSLESDGFIKIERVVGNDNAVAFGRVNVWYSIVD